MTDVMAALGGEATGEPVRGKQHQMVEPQTELERAFIAQMVAENYSIHTMRQRIGLLRGLPDPATATADDVLALLASRPLSPDSRASYVTVLKATYADLIRLGLVETSPLARMKTPRTARKRPRPLSNDQLAALETLGGRFEREHAQVILGAYAGLRAGEVGMLPGSALQYRTNGPVLRVTGKGGLTADIPAHPKVVAVMEPFLGQSDPIWDMWPQSVNRAFQKAARSVGIREHVVFHQLRHTFATRLTRAGVDLLVIAEMCRHASVATTQRYAAVSDEAPFDAIRLIA